MKGDSVNEFTSWFFIGDTIDWLRTHDRVTGVGRVTCELYMAALTDQGHGAFMPCVAADTECGLASVSSEETALYLNAKLGARPASELFDHVEGVRPAPITRSFPRRGDHIVFTGAIWTRHYADLFIRLNDHGITFSVLVYDIIPIETPDFVSDESYNEFVAWLKVAVALSSVIYVSGPSVREQLIRWSVLAGRQIFADIVIVEYGLSDGLRDAKAGDLSMASLAAKDVNLASFVVSVGTVDKRKNQILLCRLWPQLVGDLGAENVPQLVLAGRDDLDLTHSCENFAGLIKSKKIVILQGLSDSELFALYRACLFTAFPSLSEGYGLPVAESLHVGKVCVAGDLPATRDHAGDLPWYFDPASSAMALMQLRKAIMQPELRAAAELRILNEFRARTWVSTLGSIATAVAGAADATTPVARLFSTARLEPRYLRPMSIPAALSDARAWCTAQSPDVSILIINWNASELTLECVRQIWANTCDIRYEIIIADNGSTARELHRLRHLRHLQGVRVLKLGCNRYFNEAGNIAAEHALGRYLCVLHNDMLVQRGWLKPLVASLEMIPEVAVVGPVIVFPNGLIQEAGVTVDERGFLIRGDGGNHVRSNASEIPRSVDCVSAAALLVSRDSFMLAGGFDFSYEPHHYEDIDFCFKLRALGKQVLLCPRSRVMRLERPAGDEDAVAAKRRQALIELNRGKFAERWGEYLRARHPNDATKAARNSIQSTVAQVRADGPRAARPTAAVYTPYPLTLGGGERYILTFAWALCERFAVTVVTPNPYSRLRLRALGREFGLDLSECELTTLDQLRTRDRPDFMVAMTNHVVPPIELLGPRGLFICQFPFPLPQEEIAKSKDLLSAWNRILVYSEYSKAHVSAALSAHQLPQVPIDVLSPPVQQIEATTGDKKNIILSVGRFFDDNHSKRQDLMIEAFRSLSRVSGSGIELHLAGSSIPSHMPYLNRLQQMAHGADVFFHVNAPAWKLAQLYREATIYWHGAGLEADLERYPERAEHFGIAVVEAMSAGCIPIAFNAGGPREIIQHGKSGFLCVSVADMVRITADLLKPQNTATRAALAEAARQRAKSFSVASFAEKVRTLADRTMQLSAATRHAETRSDRAAHSSP